MNHQEKLEGLKKLILKDKITLQDVKAHYDGTIRSIYFANTKPGEIECLVWGKKPFDMKSCMWNKVKDDLNFASTECINVLYEYLVSKA